MQVQLHHQVFTIFFLPFFSYYLLSFSSIILLSLARSHMLISCDRNLLLSLSPSSLYSNFCLAHFSPNCLESVTVFLLLFLSSLLLLLHLWRQFILTVDSSMRRNGSCQVVASFEVSLMVQFQMLLLVSFLAHLRLKYLLLHSCMRDFHASILSL